jgi:hypothetical protein
MGNSVTCVESSAFLACTSLAAIAVDRENSAYCSLDGVLFDKGQATLLQYPQARAGDYVIPDGVTSLGTGELGWGSGDFGWLAFDGSASLTGVTIPTSVTSIGARAFSGCSSLSSITIPASVTSIEAYGAFSGCAGLQAIHIDPGNPSYTSVDGVWFDKSGADVLRYPPGKVGSYKLPNGVTDIRYGAFSGCTSLTDITIPATLTQIWNYAFTDCAGLTALYFAIHRRIQAVKILPGTRPALQV